MAKNNYMRILPPLKEIGEDTDYGKIVAIKFIEGGRYYFCETPTGHGYKVVSMIPSDVFESQEAN